MYSNLGSMFRVPPKHFLIAVFNAIVQINIIGYILRDNCTNVIKKREALVVIIILLFAITLYGTITSLVRKRVIFVKRVILESAFFLLCGKSKLRS